MAKSPNTTESCHLRLPIELINRIQVRMDREHRKSFNNTCEILLYEAITAWEDNQ